MVGAPSRFSRRRRGSAGNRTPRRRRRRAHRRAGSNVRATRALRGWGQRRVHRRRMGAGWADGRSAMSAITAELTIDRLAAGGEGVGRHEGMAVFVPRTAPGDRVRARLELHRRFARGTVETLLEPSPDRVEPPCKHYREDRCGGCQLQHLAYDAQVHAKGVIVRDALVRIGKRDVDAPVVEPSAQQWRYRRKLTLAMRRRADGSWLMGLHPYDDPVGVFQLDDCPITDERVVAVWREIMSAGELLPPLPALRGAVQLAESEAVFSLEGAGDWTTASEFFDAVPAVAALWWKADGRGRALVARRGAATSDPS